MICARAPGEGKTSSADVPDGRNLQSSQSFLIPPSAANLQQIFSQRLKWPVRLGAGPFGGGKEAARPAFKAIRYQAIVAIPACLCSR
jgi:hypothetical protein